MSEAGGAADWAEIHHRTRRSSRFPSVASRWEGDTLAPSPARPLPSPAALRRCSLAAGRLSPLAPPGNSLPDLLLRHQHRAPALPAAPHGNKALPPKRACGRCGGKASVPGVPWCSWTRAQEGGGSPRGSCSPGCGVMGGMAQASAVSALVRASWGFGEGPTVLLGQGGHEGLPELPPPHPNPSLCISHPAGGMRPIW